MELIRLIQAQRGSRVISYVTGDRAPFTTQIAEDAVLVLRRHLDAIGKTEKIDLFVYSRGGDMVAPLRIVGLIREHCDAFGVLVPYRAHSAATSIALGADEIVMGKAGELSPVDPTTGHPFNPQDPNNPQKRIPISVEDVTSYFLLAKEKAGIRDEQMVAVFNELANKINPLALGNVYRTYRMARLLTEKLLGLHMDTRKQQKEIQEIVAHLTEKLCIHAYPITRAEAETEIGLKITKPEGQLEALIWDLYGEYEQDMKLREPFEPLQLLGSDEAKTVTVHGSYIESEDMSDAFLFKADITRADEAGRQAAVNIQTVGWRDVTGAG
jgi:hypothetical protein